MNNTGFIAIHRQMLEWKYYYSETAVKLWIHILLKANWKDGYFLGVPIPKGSFATSIATLEKETGISHNTIRKWLKRFESDGQIEVKSTNRFTTIKVANYAMFQDISPHRGGELYGEQGGELYGERCGDNRTTINKNNKETNIRERVERESQLSSPSLPPTLREISDFVGKEKLNVDPSRFWQYYNEWGKPFPADWQTRCRRWSETEYKNAPQQPTVVEGPEWLKYTNVEYDPDKIDF